MKLSPGSRRALIAAGASLVLFGAVGFFVLPPIVKAQAQRRLSAGLGRSVSIGKVRVNPFALSLILEDLDIRERDGSGSFLGWRRLYVRFDALASLMGDWVLGAIEVDGFHTGVVLNRDGSFNFSDLLARLAPTPGQPAKPARPVRIGRLSVSGARVDFSDRSLKHPFTTIIGPMTFALSDFRSMGARDAPYRFEAQTEAGERLAWSGRLSADPLVSRGEFQVEDLNLKKYTPYFERMTRADLAEGKLSVHGRYVADFEPARRELTLNDAEVHLRGVKVLERSGGNSVAAFNALDVTGLQADALSRKASVARVSISGVHLAVRRAKDGSINLVELLKPAGPEAAAPVGGPPSGSVSIPQLSAGELAVTDGTLDIADDAVPGGAHLSLGGVQLSVRNVTLADGASMPIHVQFGWLPKGAVQIDGAVGLKPNLKADLKVSVTALEMLPLSPYLEALLNARIIRGAVSTSDSLHASMSGGRLAGNLDGDASVDRLGFVDKAQDKELAGVAHLELRGLKLNTEPHLAASVAEVDVAGPYARVRVNADKSLNFASLLGSPASLRGGIPAAAVAVPAPKIQVDRVVITGGDFSFSDRSIEPNVRMSLGDFAGTISGLSSTSIARADVALKGTVDGAGPVAITGKLDPLGAHTFIGLKIDVSNMDLLFLGPYSGRYAGYELARGQLAVDSRILVDGDAVDSTNVVTLKQFTFGEPTSSRDATALPVRLGVALLKDTSGNIVIDLPVQGSLANPDFRVGKVVLRVIVNLLTKAAISPFSLVGSMFGGGGEELAFQEFVPGSGALQQSELPKLETLSKALANRPALSLSIEGDYDAAADAYSLKRSKLAGMIRRKIWEERHAANPMIAPPDELAISPEEHAAMVKRLFDSKFPPGTQFGTPLPPPPAVVAPPPGPKPGFLARVGDFLTFKRQRDRRALDRETRKMTVLQEQHVAKAIATGLPLDEMTGRLAESMQVTDNDLEALAALRARNVRDHLMASGHIATDRLFLAKASGPGQPNRGPRVLLTLQ